MIDEYIPPRERPRKYIETTEAMDEQIAEYLKAEGYQDYPNNWGLPTADEIITSIIAEIKTCVLRELLMPPSHSDAGISLTLEDGELEIQVAFGADIFAISEPIKLEDLLKEIKEADPDDWHHASRNINKWSAPY